jgi:large subunit ribosomal protein L5
MLWRCVRRPISPRGLDNLWWMVKSFACVSFALSKMEEKVMLKEQYESTIRSELLTELNAENTLRAPRVEKIVVSMGVGNYKENDAYLTDSFEDLKVITGQTPVYRRARKAESGFKLRKGDIIGLQVTMRSLRMWNFLEKLIGVALPRVRDFRGVSLSSFDGHGNYNLGILEHQIFPEVDPNKLKWSKSLQVTIVTSPAVTDEEAKLLLYKLGMPFAKNN